MQQVLPLDSETALKVTTALYYSPSGRSIDTEIKENKYRKLLGMDIEGEDAEEDSTVFYTLKLERKVFGGGAVTPDIEVEVPKITELETKIYQKGLFLTFSVEYTSKHKLEKGFSIDDNILNSFKAYLKKKELEFTDNDFEGSIEGIKIGLKRNIAIKLWGIKSSYESVLSDDIQVTKSLEILEESNKTEDLFSLIEAK